MVNRSIHITSVLLATVLCAVLMTAKACPLLSNCTQDQECQAYNNAKAATRPVYLNVNATLSDFTNTPDEFNQKLGTDYEIDGTPDEEGFIGRQAKTCYKLSNQEVGCREIMEVEGRNCTWLPLYIWRASCRSESQTIYYPVPVLKHRDVCSLQPTWQLVMEKIPVGCKC